MNLNFYGNSARFRKFTKIVLNDVCPELESVYFEINKELGNMPEYWKGMAASSFSETILQKNNKLYSMLDDLGQLAYSISKNTNLYENRKEQEIKAKKNDALNRNDMIEYARLCAKDFFDGEFDEL